MSSSFPRGGRNSTLSMRAPLMKHFNRAMEVAVAATLMHHIEIKVVEVEPTFVTNR